MFRRSEGSAPVAFLLIAGPLVASFAAVLLICLAGYQKALLTHAVHGVADRVTLADVEQSEVPEISQGIFNRLGISAATASVSFIDGFACVRASLTGVAGVRLEAVSYGFVER